MPKKLNSVLMVLAVIAGLVLVAASAALGCEDPSEHEEGTCPTTTSTTTPDSTTTSSTSTTTTDPLPVTTTAPPPTTTTLPGNGSVPTTTLSPPPVGGVPAGGGSTATEFVGSWGLADWILAVGTVLLVAGFVVAYVVIERR